ncbi:SMI1/KNR4 family protein [Fulvivirgaceae bacterium PWU5]|uniref:SMI1/KNR4 family protein n=1 Tax=Dawidia cretensis TaxID=2782350 RepID=A0AAP2E1T9_9BACT|nr:SMI1/KNR4 family protein [Dawidia cretensis]MBT1709954.1 SMI1/KNR4 family protein [Dawidia cretensis]
MKYLNFIDPSKIKAAEGCLAAEIAALEHTLNTSFPDSFREYLFLMGRKTVLFSEYHHHGFDELEYIRNLFFDWVNKYKEEGSLESELDHAIPFLKFQDTFLYVLPGLSDSGIYAMDINDRPTVAVLNVSFADFLQGEYNKFLTRGLG